MTTRIQRPTIDLEALRPEDLNLLSDEDFRLVVDADTKKGASHGTAVPEWISEALRTTHLSRWYTTLRRALASVDGQLDAKDAEFEAEKAALNLQVMAGDESAAVKLEQFKVRHFQTRSRSLRFRSGLKDVLAQADALRNDRVAKLEAAIRAHRGAIGTDDPDTTEADRDLWRHIS